MTAYALERSLHILGPVLGRKRGVQVRIGGERACTDGHTIWLPALPLADAEAAALGFGLLFHETNHLRYTDFAVSKDQGLAGALTNALEDIRIDRLGQQEYRGARREEEELVAALTRRGEAKACSEADHPARILESYVMWRLEHDLLGIAAARGIAAQAESVLRQTLGSGVQAKLDALMFGVGNCRTTGDVQALARAMARMLADEAAAEAALEPRAETAAQAAPAGRAGALRRALEAQGAEAARGIGELARAAVDAKGREAPALNVSLARSAPARSAPDRVDEGAAFALAVKATSNALRQRLAGLLQAATLSRRYPACTGARIDRRRLGRLEVGDARIFVRAMAGLKTDTAVQILLDRSGSMGASRRRERPGTPRPIEVARAAGYAAALALQPMAGIAVAAAAFPGHGHDEVAVLAQFGERVQRRVARFASLEASGGTPLAEAMLWAAAELARQPQARRILLVATDGAYDAAVGRRMSATLSAAGIETLGIGIHCDVAPLFARARAIVTVADLPQAMFALLLEALAARRHRSANATPWASALA